MVEVTLKIRFLQPCLGAKPRRLPALGARAAPGDVVTVFCLPRTGDGRVMFPPEWWRAIVVHGARVKGGSAAEAGRICWSIEVDGVVQRWLRHVQPDGDRRGYHVHHEAFMPGTVVSVDCVLPDGLDMDRFRTWAAAGGKYLGISPYKKAKWGRFEVVDVVPGGGA
jgi:hypothetical protein